jgi:hypothetical protein
VWNGDIEVMRLFGRGSVDYARRSEPIRYGCALLIRVYLAVMGVVGVIALAPQVPANQWMAASGVIAASASVVASWRLGRPSLDEIIAAFADVSAHARLPGHVASLPRGSMKQLASAALRARTVLPDPDAGYRDGGSPPHSTIRTAIEAVTRVERLKTDAAGFLAFSAAAVSIASVYMALTGARETWAILVAVLTASIAAASVWRWWQMRRAIGVGVDVIAAAAAKWKPER